MDKPLDKMTKSQLLQKISQYKAFFYEMTVTGALDDKALSEIQELIIDHGMTSELAPGYFCTVTFRGQAWTEEDFRREMERIKEQFLHEHAHLATGSEDGGFNEVEIGWVHADDT